MTKISIDMNTEEFQSSLIKLETVECAAFLRVIKKIKQLTWDELYADKGIR